MLSDNRIKEVLDELLIRRRNGEFDIEEQFSSENEKLWKNTIPYNILRECLLHRIEEIRLSALALLVESKKSTLKFTSAELDLIATFVEHNFTEKPDYIAFIKKTLKRIKDSLAVMRRKSAQEKKMRDHYAQNCEVLASEERILESHRISNEIAKHIDIYGLFCEKLHCLCLTSLFPGATYFRRRSSLQILLLMQDFLDGEFENVTWHFEDVEKVFQCMILDTYEANKELAFNIIKSIDKTLLRLEQEDRVCEIVTVAFELGNGIRPIDSVTATYMLKVSLLSPIIQTVLQTKFPINQCLGNSTDAVKLHLILLLLQKLEQSLTLAKENIVLTVTKHSLYGYLFCLKSLISECNLRDAGKDNLWQRTINTLILVCFELNQAVSVIVNNSSPEGHLPMDLSLQAINEVHQLSPEKEVVTPQMVLLCSWRTVKEVSLLFGLLATKSPICEANSPVELLTEEQIIKIGEHLVTLLSETKHRGAFEQAHVGFSQLCIRLWRLKKESLSELPMVWLHQILVAITGFSQGNTKLCATRRSAGVPFMVQALLSSEPRPQKDTETFTFHSVMKILLGLTQLESRENLWEKVKSIMYKNSAFLEYEHLFQPLKFTVNCTEQNDIQITEIKTHALNILRAIFRHSQLGELVKNYVTDGLIAAFKSYDGKTWAERNAATLLYSALIIRIFGVQRTKDHINLTTDNKMTAKIFFERYPNLLSFILNELKTFVQMKDSIMKSNVQPILLLLSRLYVRQSSDTVDVDSEINEIINLVSQCGKSPVHETRELAARALVPLLSEETAQSMLKILLQKLIASDHLTFNLRHGYMLQILKIIKQFSIMQLHVREDHSELVLLAQRDVILRSLEKGNQSPACFPLATVYITIFHEIYTDDHEIKLISTNMLHTLVQHLVKEDLLKQGPGREIYKTRVLNFVLHISKKSSLRAVFSESILLDKMCYCILNTREPGTQAIAWAAVAKIVGEDKEPDDTDTKKLLYCYALNLVRNSMGHIHKYHPELQDAIFNFLHDSLLHKSLSPFWKEMRQEICVLVLKDMQASTAKNCYCERDSYLRLFGKSYVTMHNIENDSEHIEILKKCKTDVFDNFCDSSWVACLATNFRASVFDTILELFHVLKMHESTYVKIQWWTMLLQLLLDDNYEVRNEASRIVRKIANIDSNECISVTLRVFFREFYKNLCELTYPIGCIALFSWSMSLLDDTDYEMDETDVFNKCRNYEVFEQATVTDLCAEYLKLITEKYSIDETLPAEAIDWINNELNVDLPKSISFRKLVQNYRNYIPTLEGKLRDILNPTYKNKLEQILSYKYYAFV